MENKQEAAKNHHTEQQLDTTPHLGIHHLEESSGEAEKVLDTGIVENGPAEHLTPEHREYLVSRHKTVDLNPLPTMDPADPLNWPSWKVLCGP